MFDFLSFKIPSFIPITIETKLVQSAENTYHTIQFHWRYYIDYARRALPQAANRC